MADPADLAPGSPMPPLAQVICTQCRARRFFAYIVKGELELTCTECGTRLIEITRGHVIPAAFAEGRP